MWYNRWIQRNLTTIFACLSSIPVSFTFHLLSWRIRLFNRKKLLQLKTNSIRMVFQWFQCGLSMLLDLWKVAQSVLSLIFTRLRCETHCAITVLSAWEDTDDPSLQVSNFWGQLVLKDTLFMLALACTCRGTLKAISHVFLWYTFVMLFRHSCHHYH